MSFIAHRASRFFQDLLPEELCDILHRRQAGAADVVPTAAERDWSMRRLWCKIMRHQVRQRIEEQTRDWQQHPAWDQLELVIGELNADELETVVRVFDENIGSTVFGTSMGPFGFPGVKDDRTLAEIRAALATYKTHARQTEPRLKILKEELCARAVASEVLSASVLDELREIAVLEKLAKHLDKVRPLNAPPPLPEWLAAFDALTDEQCRALHVLLIYFRNQPAEPAFAYHAFLKAVENARKAPGDRAWLAQLLGNPVFQTLMTEPKWKMRQDQVRVTCRQGLREQLQDLIPWPIDPPRAHSVKDAAALNDKEREAFRAEVAVPPVLSWASRFMIGAASDEQSADVIKARLRTIIENLDRHQLKILEARFAFYSDEELGDFLIEMAAQGNGEELKHWLRLRALTPEQVRDYAISVDTVGLALSGGGIRSATFGLGGLQYLAEIQLLPLLDYQSSVSGGGYISSWLAAWIKREQPAEDTPLLRNNSAIKNVSEQLQPNRRRQARAARSQTIAADEVVDGEPYPLYHLRAYSNYLAPRLGVFSADGWTMVSICLRNFLLNQAVFLLVALACWCGIAGVIRLFVVAAELPRLLASTYGGPTDWMLIGIGLTVTLSSLILTMWGINALLPDGEEAENTAGGQTKLTQAKDALQRKILSPLGLAAVCAALTAAFWKSSVDQRQLSAYSWWIRCIICSALGVLPVLWYTRYAWLAWIGLGAAKPADVRQRWSALCGLCGGLLVFGLFAGLFSIHPPDAPRSSTTFSVPAYVVLSVPGLLLAFVVSCYMYVGVLRERLSAAHSEWWSSVTAWVLMLGGGWLAAAGLVVFGTWAFVPEWQSHGGLKIAAAASWVVTTIGGLYSAQSAKIDGDQPPSSWTGMIQSGLALIAPVVFLIGYGLALSIGAYWILFATCAAVGGGDPAFTHETYWEAFRIHLSGSMLEIVFVVIEPMVFLAAARAVIWITMNWVGQIVDVNLFSLESLYGNRLVRCYLGASRPPQPGFESPVQPAATNSHGAPRNPVALTGFDVADDIVLADFAPDAGSPDGKLAYTGPILILNAALNLASGRELAWQERKAESFVFTPRYSGSASTNYRTSREYGGKYGGKANLTLGKAVAVSGAAVSPNMGYHSSPAVTALLTLFNIRLGAWVGNPKRATWRDRGPRAGVATLLGEALSRTDAEDEYIYLSDGGHFDNLGIYELIRRRCRFIIAYDAGADPAFAFDDLAMAIRKVRIDFGVRIVIDVEPLRPRGPNRLSSRHVAVGKIYYKDVDAPVSAPVEHDAYFQWSPVKDPLEGVLIYIKPALTGDESADVENFKVAHTDFPHQTTLDQFFSESQFESYRALGYHSFREAVQPALERFLDDLKKTRYRQNIKQEDAPRLFEEIFAHWCSMPAEFSDAFMKVNDAYIAIQRDLGSRGELWRFADEIRCRNQFGLWKDREPHEQRAERAMVAQILTLMENAFFNLKLDEYLEHPKNSGWKQTFEVFANTPTFKYWYPGLLSEFSEPVRKFVSRTLILTREEMKKRKQPIEDLARRKWEAAGRPANRDDEFWFDAERELRVVERPKTSE